jgi:hypothetical protein
LTKRAQSLSPVRRVTALAIVHPLRSGRGGATCPDHHEFTGT